MTGHCAIDAAGDARLLYAVPVTEHNPRGVKMGHRGPGDHTDCSLGPVLTCAVCHLGFTYCWAPPSEVKADLQGWWTCAPCGALP